MTKTTEKPLSENEKPVRLDKGKAAEWRLARVFFRQLTITPSLALKSADVKGTDVTYIKNGKLVRVQVKTRELGKNGFLYTGTGIELVKVFLYPSPYTNGIHPDNTALLMYDRLIDFWKNLTEDQVLDCFRKSPGRDYPNENYDEYLCCPEANGIATLVAAIHQKAIIESLIPQWVSWALENWRKRQFPRIFKAHSGIEIRLVMDKDPAKGGFFKLIAYIPPEAYAPEFVQQYTLTPEEHAFVFPKKG